jgi:hypothetical protein
MSGTTGFSEFYVLAINGFWQAWNSSETNSWTVVWSFVLDANVARHKLLFLNSQHEYLSLSSTTITIFTKGWRSRALNDLIIMEVIVLFFVKFANLSIRLSRSVMLLVKKKRFNFSTLEGFLCGPAQTKITKIGDINLLQMCTNGFFLSWLRFRKVTSPCSKAQKAICKN